MRKILALIALAGILVLIFFLFKNRDVLKEDINPAQGEATTTAFGTPIATSTKTDLAEPPSAWKTYTYGEYRITFPSEPKITGGEKEVGGVTYAALASNQASYFLTVSTIPDEVMKFETSKILQSAITSTVKNLGGSLEGAIDTGNLTGLNSVDFVVDIPDGPRTYMARDIVVGNKLLELRVVYVTAHGIGVEYRGFIDSFKLTH